MANTTGSSVPHDGYPLIFRPYRSQRGTTDLLRPI